MGPRPRSARSLTTPWPPSGATSARSTAPADLISAVGALHLIGMVGAARLDERADARRSLREAATAAGRLGADRNDWWLAFGLTNVAIYRVAYSVELSQARTAVRTARARRGRRGAP